MKISPNKIIALIIVLLLSSCAIKISKRNEGSIVAISATSKGLGAKGYGIIITMINKGTKKAYMSESLTPISPHSVIQNIPPGQYSIEKVSVPVGNITYSSWSDSIRTYFGEINIKANSKYYLGNFSGNRNVGRKNVLNLKIENQNIPQDLRQKIETEKTGWKTGEIIKLYPYSRETLLVY